MFMLSSAQYVRRVLAGVLLSHCLLAASSAQSQSAPVSVLTQRYDNFRSGVNANETILNTSNVQPATFGRLFSRQLDFTPIGARCQPLYMPNLNIQGTLRNVVFVGTQGNYIYALDADDPLAPTLWTANLTPTSDSVSILGGSGQQWIPGLVSTPVIDPETNTLYAVCKTVAGPINRPASFVFRLHALDLLTGQEKPGSPVFVNFSVQGSGAGSVRRVISFNGMLQSCKTGLLLTQGKLLFGFGSVDETQPNYHGYVVAYDATTLRQVGVWCSTPNGNRGGVWQSGNSFITDDNGNVWVATGNGTSNPPTNDYSVSVVHLSVSQSGIKAVDYFLPNDNADLNANDKDLGVCGPMFIPGSPYLLQGSKTGFLYMLDPNNLGQLGTTNDANVPQRLNGTTGELHANPIAYAGPDGSTSVFMWAATDTLRCYKLLPGGLLDASSLVQGTTNSLLYGGFLTLSAQGATAGTGILWSYRTTANTYPYASGILEAFDAETLDEIWSSYDNRGRDDCGNYVRWLYPMVANGKVFLGSASGELLVYGLLNSGVPAAPTGLNATLNGATIQLSWLPVAGAIAYNVRNGPFTGGIYNLTYNNLATTQCSLSFLTGGLNGGKNNYYVVSAVNAQGESVNSAELVFSPWPAAPRISKNIINNTTVQLSWTASSRAQTYTLERSTKSGGPYTVLASGLTTLSYTDSGLSPGTRYYWVVTATNSFGVSINSNQVSN